MTTLPDKIGHVRGAPTGLSTTPPPQSREDFHAENNVGYPPELHLPDPIPGEGWHGNDHFTGGECDGWVTRDGTGWRWVAWDKDYDTIDAYTRGYENTRDLAMLRVTAQLRRWEAERGDGEACEQD